jgi:hypothetical protein
MLGAEVSRGASLWPKIVTLYAVISAASASAQAIVDFAQTPSAKGQLMVKLEKPAYSQPRAIVIDSSFFTADKLRESYNRGPFLIQYLDAHLQDLQDGEVRVAAPIWFKSAEQLRQNQSLYKERLTNCITSGSNSACLLELNSAAKKIPANLGKVRKVLLAGDFIVMTMTDGQILVYRMEGSYTEARAKLYLVKVPSPLKEELLFQNLTRVYFGSYFDKVVTGVNGSLGSQAFGSKLWSFDGNSKSDHISRRSFLRPLARGNYGLFESRSYYYIDVALDPLPWVPGISALGRAETVRLRINDLGLEH